LQPVVGVGLGVRRRARGECSFYRLGMSFYCFAAKQKCICYVTRSYNEVGHIITHGKHDRIVVYELCTSLHGRLYRYLVDLDVLVVSTV
jgi:hypothetical protein